MFGRAGGGSDPFNVPHDDLMDQRSKAKPTFDELEKTNEYGETYYYSSKRGNLDSSSLIQSGPFWIDYADFLITRREKPELEFLSSNFIYL